VYDDVHSQVDDEPDAPRAKPSPPPDAEMPPLPPLGLQVSTLTSRYATCIRRQRRSLAILLGQAPIIGLAVALVVPSTEGRTVDLTPFYTLIIATSVVIGALWMGLISACRESAGAIAILRRETAVGVRIDAYLLSKCAVLLPIAAAQVALLLAPLIVLQPLGNPAEQYLLAFPVLVMAAFTGSMLGLLISSLVRSAGQATTAVPVVMLPQLLFAGALIARSAMAPPMQFVSDLMPSRWTLSSVGSAFDLNQLVQGNLGGITGLEASFFDVSPVVGLAILGAASVALYVITGIVLSWRLGDASPGRQAAD
ncbi:MAG TPA: ABC transporter permease, partial [Solirubrobacteraceae bacterium]